MAKKRLVGVVFGSLLTVAGWAATPNPSVIATPPQPIWTELTVQQKTVLAPLAADWDALEYYRRKKWLGIAVRFPSMTPDEQRRVQRQMQEWTKLTPEQRRLAREKYQAVTQLSTEKKQELRQKWQEYSNLPEEEKEKHKQQAIGKPAVKPARAATAAGAAALPPPVPAPSAAPATVPAGTPPATEAATEPHPRP